MKILKTARFDLSDLNVFNNAAKPGEIAIPGSFAFVDKNYKDLNNKEKLSFQMSWLGVKSFGYSTFVEIHEVRPEEMDAAIESLAAHFVQAYGAPSITEALPVAQDEINYAASLCEFEPGTILAISREETEDGIKESIRQVDPNGADLHQGLKVWEIVVEDEE